VTTKAITALTFPPSIHISRHVVFEEADFPFSASPHPTNDLDLLSSNDDVVV
jgi:hypothetical protein